MYCLLHPRKEIIKIATECEKTLKSLTKKDFMKKNCVNKIKVQIIHCFFNPEEITFFNEVDVCNHKRKIVEMIITTYLLLRFKHYAKLQNQEQEIVVFFKELCHFMRICVLYTKEVADYSWLTVRILASFFVYKTHIPIMQTNQCMVGWLVK